MLFQLTLQLFLMFFGTGFKVLTVVRIHNEVWLGHHIVWHMVMNILEEYSGSIFTGHRGCMSQMKPQYPTFRLHVP
jgi:hypothetical protein